MHLRSTPHALSIFRHLFRHLSRHLSRHPSPCAAAPAAAPPWQVAGADAVLSLLPAPLHATVAEQCIAARTPLVTASYVSPELAELHDGARRASVPLLCELGLDPGLDHMSAAAMIAQAHTDL